MQEIWKDIEGFPGYKISNLGNLLGKKGQLLNPWKDSKGYLRTELYHGGTSKPFSVHRLVAIAFIPNPENKPEVNHKFGIKDDNRVSELEWVTGQENQDHAVIHGLKCLGERNPSAKLRNSDIPVIKGLISQNISQRDIAKHYGVAHCTIGSIHRNKKWNHAKLQVCIG